MVAKSLSLLLVVGLLVSGCGKKIPVIGSPADGQKIALDQTPYFQVALADVNEYQGTTIEVRGADQFAGDLACTPGNQQPAICSSRGQNGFGGGFNQKCTATEPCMLVLIARNGEQIDVKTISVSRTSAVPSAPPPTR